jgi:hypothetical protein
MKKPKIKECGAKKGRFKVRKFIHICLLLLTTQIFSIDLWNGFTSTMSEESLIKRAEELNIIVLSEDRFINDGFLRNEYQDGYGFPELLILPMYSSEQVYFQSESKKNIYACFYNGKLFAIRISWMAKSESVFAAARKQYGNPTKVMEDFFSNYYYWKLSDKDFFIDSFMSIFIDRSVREKWIAEQKVLENRRRAEIEAKGKEEIDNIQF